MEKGVIPNDLELVGPMVRNICFANAQAYFQTNRHLTRLTPKPVIIKTTPITRQPFKPHE
jgi:hypothetical protein